MIEIKKNPIYSLKIGANKVTLKDKLLLSQFNNYLGAPVFGMCKKIGHTIVVDLSLNEDELLSNCKSNTRNEIRRAIRENFFFEKEESISNFVKYYNDFASEKGIPTITESDITCYADHIEIYKSGKDGKIMTMHANIIDEDNNTATLLYSASIRLSDGVDRKDIGFSNRFLHYKEFILFKQNNLRQYDFNGISIDPDDKERYAISQFKASFGGEQKEVTWLYSWPFIIINKIKNIIK